MQASPRPGSVSPKPGSRAGSKARAPGEKAPTTGPEVAAQGPPAMIIGVAVVGVVALVAVAALVFTFTRPAEEFQFGPVGKLTESAFAGKTSRAAAKEKRSAGRQFDPVDCYDVKENGANYGGKVTRTQSGKRCLRWNDVHRRLESRVWFNREHFGVAKLYNQGSCANPGYLLGVRMIWCFHGTNPQDFERCNVNECPSHQSECSTSERYEKSCVNRGVCFTTSLRGRRHLSCRCPEGWEGSRCQHFALPTFEVREDQIHTAHIAAGLSVAMIITFFVLMALYVWHSSKRQSEPFYAG